MCPSRLCHISMLCLDVIETWHLAVDWYLIFSFVWCNPTTDYGSISTSVFVFLWIVRIVHLEPVTLSQRYEIMSNSPNKQDIFSTLVCSAPHMFSIAFNMSYPNESMIFRFPIWTRVSYSIKLVKYDLLFNDDRLIVMWAPRAQSGTRSDFSFTFFSFLPD